MAVPMRSSACLALQESLKSSKQQISKQENEEEAALGAKYSHHHCFVLFFTSSAQCGQKRESDPSELELQTVVNHTEVAGN